MKSITIHAAIDSTLLPSLSTIIKKVSSDRENPYFDQNDDPRRKTGTSDTEDSILFFILNLTVVVSLH
jgi:hypothetical protein